MSNSVIDQEPWARLFPDAYLKNQFQKISRPCRLAFFSALLFGFLTHLFMFVNKLPNGDDLESVYRNYSMITSGRWFDKIAMSLSSYYSMPWVTGVVAVFFLALAAALIVSVLDLKRPGSAVMTSALITTSPILAASFSYLFYADVYMIALFLSVGAVWLTKVRWYGFLPGAIGLALALGCYQIYVGAAMVLCIFSLLQVILNNQKSTLEVLWLAFRYLCAGILGVILYFTVLKYCLAYFHLELDTYQGIDQMGQVASSVLLDTLPQAYSDFYAFFFHDLYFQSPPFVKNLYSLVFLLIAVFTLLAVIQNQVYRKAAVLLVPLLLAALPPVCQLIVFIAPQAFLHILMYPQYVLFPVMPFFLSEAACRYRENGWNPWKITVPGSWILLIVSCLLSYHFYLTSNICYLHLHLKYEITYATELRILDRIEQHPAYTRDTPVFFVGAFPNPNHSLYPAATNALVRKLQGINGNLVHHDLNYEGFYGHYLGVHLNLAAEEQKNRVLDKLKDLNMPVWPETGSVDMVDGVMVVHLKSPP